MTVRGVDWAVVLGGSAIGAVILGCSVAFAEDDPPLQYFRLALVVLAAAAAFVLDEPAAAAVDAVPATRRARTVIRATAVAVPLAVWVCGILALEQRHTATPTGALVVEGAGVLAVAVALACILRIAGRVEPGEIAASVVGSAILGLIVFPQPRSVPLFPTYDDWAASTSLWGCLAVAAVILAIAASGDPYRRRTRPGRSEKPTGSGAESAKGFR
jgi:hypothetical protein